MMGFARFEVEFDGLFHTECERNSGTTVQGGTDSIETCIKYYRPSDTLYHQQIRRLAAWPGRVGPRKTPASRVRHRAPFSKGQARIPSHGDTLGGVPFVMIP